MGGDYYGVLFVVNQSFKWFSTYWECLQYLKPLNLDEDEFEIWHKSAPTLMYRAG